MASPFVRRQQEHATKAFAIGVGLLPGPGAEGWVLRGINRAAGSPRSKNAARIHSIFTDFRSCVCQFFNQPFGRWLLLILGVALGPVQTGAGACLREGKWPVLPRPDTRSSHVGVGQRLTLPPLRVICLGTHMFGTAHRAKTNGFNANQTDNDRRVLSKTTAC